jgi:hypothetical protein
LPVNTYQIPARVSRKLGLVYQIKVRSTNPKLPGTLALTFQAFDKNDNKINKSPSGCVKPKLVLEASKIRDDGKWTYYQTSGSTPIVPCPHAIQPRIDDGSLVVGGKKFLYFDHDGGYWDVECDFLEKIKKNPKLLKDLR